jgi:hypothetical protein
MSDNSDNNHFVCADCGATDCQWAIVNRGVFVCTECCYVHRNLGRHISEVKSLKNGHWNSSQLELVQFLFREGANNIWEHSLLTEAALGKEKIKRKPVSNDPVIPKKEAFIKSKYVDLQFVLKPSSSSDYSIDDLNKQLYSCVRTSHVETVLRLLACGADPNYVNEENNGNTPMHVAAKECQPLQVELLYIYGADPAKPNSLGQTPSHLARQEGNEILANRLIELEFEVTDKFSQFLSGRKPDHTKAVHFLIPEIAGQLTEPVKRYKLQMQRLKDLAFERIVQDIYDEIDRRIVNNEWSHAPPYHLGNHEHVAAFLPPNERLTATRNQMRQKLAKLDNHGFSLLIIEVLKECRRRYFGLPLPPEDLNQSFGKGLLDASALSLGLTAASPDDENNDYDEVADLNRKSSASQGTKRSSGARGVISENEECFSPSKKQNGSQSVSWDDYLELKENLQEALSRLALVTQSSTELIKSQRILQRNVEQLKDQNDELKRDFKHIQNLQQHQTTLLSKRNPSPTGLLSPSSRDPPQIGAVILPAGNILPRSTRSAKGGDSSADEMSSTSMGNIQRSISSATPAEITAAALQRYGRRHGSLSSASGGVGGSAFQPLRSGPLGYQVARPPPMDRTRNGSAPPSEIPIRDGITTDSNQTINSSSGLRGMFNEETFPDNLIIETELLTGAIRALLSELQQEGIHANAAFHSDSINHHIQRIIKVIPPSHRVGNVEDCVRKMKSAMQILSQKCRSRPLVSADDTCHASYDVAKAAKQLLVNVHQFDG